MFGREFIHCCSRLLSFTCIIGGTITGGAIAKCQAKDFDDFLKPLLVQKCTKCHGGKKVSGKVNFKKITSAKQLLDKPELIKEMMEAIDANDMPPESEPRLDKKTRGHLLASLKKLLRRASLGKVVKRNRIRRLNRFQYNNSVKDLFQLKLDVFKLPEKLMTRNERYLHPKSGRMPNRVNVVSHSLNPNGGLRNVKAFPKDLRASHGFDNQANQLTLSPLLLDAFLRLSVSILESPDFNEKNVGIWKDFFKEPSEVKKRLVIKQRLQRFLRLAFRGPINDRTLNRYVDYATKKMGQGLSYTDSMKKIASAALSSPMFIYRVGTATDKVDQYELASNLSFFLWGSCPDSELLRLAKAGELTKPKTLNKTIDRMFADPKIERFLDTFPSQWMQLENVLAATPDPAKNKFFSLDKRRPASLQMVLEPLLLFDAVFIENRPIIDLISPKFSYRSDFLKTWYRSELKPPPVDVQKIVKENQINDLRRNGLQATLKATLAKLEALTKPVRAKLLAARKKGDVKKPADLKPYAAWEFNGNLKDSVGSLHLRAFGKKQFKNGMVVLRRTYLLSSWLPINLRAKTLEVWCKVHNLNQRGGGVMGIQGPGDFFDTIVLGERKPRHWISGSNGFSRTKDFPGSTPETKSNQMLQLVMVYQTNGTTILYRDGKPYGKPFRKGSATFPKKRTAVIFGLRHLPAGGNRFLTISVDKARLYNRALTASEVAISHLGNSHISEKDLVQAFSPQQKSKWQSLRKTVAQSRVALKKVPPRRDPKQVQRNAQRKYEDEIRNKMRSTTFQRVAAEDPRYGGVITNAAMLSMTSGPKRTHPIARGAWIIEVIFNDPPPPPPNDVPPLNEESTSKNLTIREKFSIHRKNPTCAGCHSRLDPLGFALENFDITGRWRDKYENGRAVDSSGTLMRKYKFGGIVKFKASLVKEKRRFAKSFAGHMLRFAAARELTPADALTLDDIVNKTEKDNFRLKSLIREVILSQ